VEGLISSCYGTDDEYLANPKLGSNLVNLGDIPPDFFQVHSRHLKKLYLNWLTNERTDCGKWRVAKKENPNTSFLQQKN